MLSPDGTTSGQRGINMVNATATMSWSSSPGTSGNPVRYVSGLQAEADLTVDTVATINALRNAFALQSLSERDARGGTRYTELITAHFGVISPDARLQRPEYLGGSSSLVIMNPLAQTSSTDATTPQGNLVGNGVAMERTHFSKSFTEHGFIHIFVSFVIDLK